MPIGATHWKDKKKKKARMGIVALDPRTFKPKPLPEGYTWYYDHQTRSWSIRKKQLITPGLLLTALLNDKFPLTEREKKELQKLLGNEHD